MPPLIPRRRFLAGGTSSIGLLALTGLGTLTLAACDPSASYDSEVIPDLIWTYGWSSPRAVYDSTHKRIFVGGSTHDGWVTVGAIDVRGHRVMRRALVQHEPDDHNTPGMLWEPDLPPLILYGDHDRTPHLEQWTAPTPLAFGSFSRRTVSTNGDTPSYAELIRKPGTSTVLAVWRGRATIGQFASLSNDWGVHWGPPVNIWQHFKYGTHKVSADGSTLWFALANHPRSAVNEIRVWKADLATGVITNATGTVAQPQNLWALAGPIDHAPLDRAVLPQAFGSRIRLFDISNNGDLLFARWRDGDRTVSYRLMRRTGSTWVETTLCDGGVPFGYNAAHYVGGAVFDGGPDSIVLCREASGTWTLERWRHDGAWHTNVILTREDGRKLARPIIPQGSEGLGYTLLLDIHSYSATSFTSFRTDARLVRDLGAWAGR